MILQIPRIFVTLGHFSLPEKAVGLSFVHDCLWGPVEISFLKCLSGSLWPQWAALCCEKQSKVEKADVCKSYTAPSQVLVTPEFSFYQLKMCLQAERYKKIKCRFVDLVHWANEDFSRISR